MTGAACPERTKSGQPCRGRVPAGRTYCMSHDPDYANARREGNRKGGEAKANARRAIRLFSEIGDDLDASDLPTLLRGAIAAVWTGDLSPGQATAIANLAKSSVDIANSVALEERIAALEAAQGE